MKTIRIKLAISIIFLLIFSNLVLAQEASGTSWCLKQHSHKFNEWFGRHIQFQVVQLSIDS